MEGLSVTGAGVGGWGSVAAEGPRAPAEAEAAAVEAPRVADATSAGSVTAVPSNRRPPSSATVALGRAGASPRCRTGGTYDGTTASSTFGVWAARVAGRPLSACSAAVSATESTTATTASKPPPATLYAYRSPGPSAGSSCAGKTMRLRIA